MNHSYLLIGIRSGNLFSMLVRNKGFAIKNIFKILFLFNSGIWSDIFAGREKRILKRRKSSETNKSEQAPVFIIGNWRTGSTFLHQLLSVDQNFSTPNVYQVSVPDSMLTSEKYYYPIMSKALGETRPIDNVKIGFYEPQEDEYALLKTCKNTPLEDLIFPKSGDFFLSKHIDSLPPAKEDFKKAFLNFYNKLKSASGKQLLFKNPFHSLRIGMLLEIFPDAKFIHIYRNPDKVVPSTIKMWDTVGRQNALKNGWKKPTAKAVSEVYKEIILQINKEASKLNESQFCQVKYEELEQKPTQVIQDIYTKLELNYTREYQENLKEYLIKLKDFKKNKYDTPREELDTIKSIMAEVLPEYYN